ncbi:MAG: Gfo/Idh/MocA family oxidoreductase [Mesorhizobium sp.]|nr:Gfo/Idh/MocA family oxidoreductase [Mesorhizobium sp.]MBL8580328.1 Gfo/Idh/MocA family oxidoreductase [Mesorhizobium sp.]
MTRWPQVDFGHTSYDAAFVKGDVYGVAADSVHSTKRPLQIAIAGAGGVTQAKWIPAIRNLQTRGEPITVSAIADPRLDVANKAALLTGAEAFDTVKHLLELHRPDLLLVLTADSAHVTVATQAIERDIACLVEKPISRSFQEAAALARLAERQSTLLAAVANKRFSPPYAMAKALVSDGALKSAPTLFTGKFTLGYPYVDLLEGGTVHLLDLVQWFMGPVAKLHARAVKRDDGGIESATVSFSFKSGAIGSIMTSASAMSFKPWERVEIVGRNAFLVVDDQFETTLYDDEMGPAKSWRPTIPNTLMMDEAFGGYAGLLENVLDAIRGIAPLASSGLEGAATIGLIEAIYRSLSQDRDIDVAAEGLVP